MNPWIQHLKAYASKKKITYAQALKDPKAQSSYKRDTKGGAVYGDTSPPSSPRSGDTFSMGVAPEPAPSRRRPATTRAPPNGYRSPVPSLPQFIFPARLAKKPTTMSVKQLESRANGIIDMIEELQSDGYLTEQYGNTLVGDVEKVLTQRADLSVSAKHDVLTNIVKEIRQAVDALVRDQDQPDAHAF
jgi:hypothetical protein